MRFAKWLGGSVLIVGAVLSAWLSAAGAASGDAIYVVRKAPGVLSPAQKTSAGSWAKSVWPGIVAANLASIQCDNIPRVTGTGPAAIVDFVGDWEVQACETYAPTAAEKLSAQLGGKPFINGRRCHTASVRDGSLTPAQAAAIEVFARGLVGVAASEIVGSIVIKITPGWPGRITHEVGMVASSSPNAWDAAWALGDQPGGVVKTWGMVQ